MDDKILSLLEEKQFSEIKKRFSQMHAADIAEQFDDMESRETAVRLFRLLVHPYSYKFNCSTYTIRVE